MDRLVTRHILVFKFIAAVDFKIMVREPDTNIDFNGTLLLLNLYDIIKFILGRRYGCGITPKRE